MNHLALMFQSLYDFLLIPFEIDGIIFTLFDVLKAGLVFTVVGFAIKEYFGVFVDFD